MPSLESLIPEIAAYQQAQNQGMRQQSGQLAQMGALQQIMQRQQQAQDQQRLRGVLQQAAQQTGGDPAKMAPLLMQTGDPTLMQLAQRMMPKPPEERVVNPGGAIVRDGKVTYQAPFKPDAPKEFAPPEFLRLQEAAAKYPEGHPVRAQIEARIKMLQERPAGTTINMPSSSDLMKGEDGRFYRVRIGKDGKSDAIPMQAGDMQLRPPESAATAKAEEEKVAEGQTLESVRTRIAKMASLIQGGGMAGGVVGPLGMASRVGETAVGTVQPGTPTPALDYQNELRLLLSDVRKMVEKDPNLSKDEREAMYEALGGGIMQTPGSAIRALNNIVSHVESKQRIGAGRGTGIASQVQAAGWAYEPNKYEYRVVDGKVQRKAK